MITRKGLAEICERNKYILLKDRHGNWQGHNCHIATISAVRMIPKDNLETRWTAAKSCTFNEYLNKKVAFV